MAATEAQKRAIAKYERDTVERINCRLPKGTKKRIAATGYTANAFILAAVEEKLEKMEGSVPGSVQ